METKLFVYEKFMKIFIQNNNFYPKMTFKFYLSVWNEYKEIYIYYLNTIYCIYVISEVFNIL